MRSIFSGLNQIEQFRVSDKNRERENLVLKFFGFSLSSLSSLSLTSRNPLFFIHPHRILPLPTDLASGEVSSVKLELRRPSPAFGPALSSFEEPRELPRSSRPSLLRSRRRLLRLPSAPKQFVELQGGSIHVGRPPKIAARRSRP